MFGPSTLGHVSFTRSSNSAFLPPYFALVRRSVRGSFNPRDLEGPPARRLPSWMRRLQHQGDLGRSLRHFEHAAPFILVPVPHGYQRVWMFEPELPETSLYYLNQ